LRRPAGVTGADAAVRFAGHDVIAALRSGAPPPVLGFGISNPSRSAGARAGAAGVISGSAIVDRRSIRREAEDVRGFVAEMKAATLG
jgi:tryptophan synthase alpha chain